MPDSRAGCAGGGGGGGGVVLGERRIVEDGISVLTHSLVNIR